MLQDDGNLFAVAGHPQAAWTTWLGLRAMQHRAVGPAGLVVGDGAGLTGLWATGLADARRPGPRVDAMRGTLALGRLSAGSNEVALPAPADEPVLRWIGGVRHALAMAGRITNGASLRRQLLEADVPLAGASGAEVVLGLVARARGSSPVTSLVRALFDLEGAWNLVLATPDALVVSRDPRGFRPLFLGSIDGAVAVASESGALWAVGAGDVREIEPGEVVVVERGGVSTLRPFRRGAYRRAASLVDLVALARPESQVGGASCASVRVALGRALANEHPPADATMVTALASASEVAYGYAAASGRPLRATVAPQRDPGDPTVPPVGLAGRAAAAPARVQGVVDPSVVLVVPVLTTRDEIEPALVALARAGASTVHLRVATPPVLTSEPYGLALPPPEALLAVRVGELTEQARALGVVSVGYLSLEAVRATVPSWSAGWCDTPWTRALPIPAEVPDKQVAIPFPTRDGG
jgi:amidophosphoribosyltransferase